MPFALLLLALSSLVSADSGVSCGLAFRNLIHLCGQPDLSTPASCCPAIRQYNAALCWCQPTALSLASHLATNPYAFALRPELCNVSTSFRPSFANRDAPPTKETCPNTFISLPADDRSERCPNPVQLRKNRQAALAKLDWLELREGSRQAVNAFKRTTRALFVDHVSFTSVGLASAIGRQGANDLLLARQPALGAAAGWVPAFSRAEIRDGAKFWRQRKVSYTLDFASPDGRYTSRSMFVTFKVCSDKITQVYAVEQGVVDALSAQFYYPAVPRDAVSMYDRTPKQICNQIADGCGSHSPYKSRTDCENFMAGLKEARKVMCNRFDKRRVSVLALVGNTTSCRYSYALAAKADPGRYCQLLGREPKGLCAKSLCKLDQFEDIFTAKNPRYKGSNSFTCDLQSGKCTENWPRRSVS